MEFSHLHLPPSQLSIFSLPLFASLFPHSTPSVDGHFHSSCYLLLIISLSCSLTSCSFSYLPLPLFLPPLLFRLSIAVPFLLTPLSCNSSPETAFDTAYNYSGYKRSKEFSSFTLRKRKERGSGLLRSTPPITISPIVAFG